MLTKKKIEIIFAYIFLLLLIVISIYVRISAFNPRSLWLDDVWTALISKINNIEGFWLVNSSTPPLFGLSLLISSKLFIDKEISMQIIPFLISVLQIYMFYKLVFLVSKERNIALLGALCIAFNQNILIYSTHVKQYTFESFSVIFLLYLFTKTLKEFNKKKLLLTWVFSFLFLFFSFNSIFISFIFLNIFILLSIVNSNILNHGFYKNLKINKFLILLFGLSYDIGLFIYYLVILRQKTNSILTYYWRDDYLNLNQSVVNILREFVGKINVLVVNAFPQNWFLFFDNNFSFSKYLFLILIIFFVFLGFYSFLSKKNYIFVVFGLLFYFEIFILACLKIYPIGGIRTDIFSYPVTILYFIIGIKYFITKIFTKSINNFVSYIILFLLIILSFPKKVTYDYQIRSSDYVNFIESNLNDDESVLIFPHGIYAFAYYTNFPIEFIIDENVATGFSVDIKKENIYKLPFIKGYEGDGKLLKGDLDNFVKNFNTNKFYYFATSYDLPASIYINNYFLDNGYRISSKFEENDSMLIIYEK